MNLNGSNGDNRLVGTASRDTIDGNGGRDTLYGLGHHDTLIGGLGADTIFGGSGNDVIDGGNALRDATPFDGIHVAMRGDGGDTLFGGNGNDLIDGGSGNDLLYGGAGSDAFYWAGGNVEDEVYGGQQDIVRDYQTGIDFFGIIFQDGGNDWAYEPHAGDLDSNGNGRIDGGDILADLRSVTVNGITRNSLVLDLDQLALTSDKSDYFIFGGPQSLAFFGVLSLPNEDMI